MRRSGAALALLGLGACGTPPFVGAASGPPPDDPTLCAAFDPGPAALEAVGPRLQLLQDADEARRRAGAQAIADALLAAYGRAVAARGPARFAPACAYAVDVAPGSPPAFGLPIPNAAARLAISATQRREDAEVAVEGLAVTLEFRLGVYGGVYSPEAMDRAAAHYDPPPLGAAAPAR